MEAQKVIIQLYVGLKRQKNRSTKKLIEKCIIDDTNERQIITIITKRI
jgi:hypothetical protein